MILLRNLNCSLKFVVSEQNFGGYLSENGTWTGILNLMATNQIDLIAHSFSANDDRKKLLDQTFLAPREELLTILSHKVWKNNQQSDDNDSFRIFRVFSPQIWTIILLQFTLMALLMFTLWNKLLQHPVAASQTLPKKLLRLLHCHLNMFAFLMGQDFTNWKNHSSAKLTIGVVLRANTNMIKLAINKLRYPLIIWIFSSILFRQLFSSDILTTLVVEEDGEKIDYFDQLLHIASHAFNALPANIVDAKDDDEKEGSEQNTNSPNTPKKTKAATALARMKRLNSFRIFTERDSTAEKIFLERYPQLRRLLWRIAHEKTYEVQTILDIVQGNHVMILGRFKATLMQKIYEHLVDLHVSHEGFLSTLSAMAFRKDLQQRERSILMRLSRTIFSSGLDLIFREKWIHYNLKLVRRQHWLLHNSNNNENNLNDPKDATKIQLEHQENDCPEHNSQESCSNIRLTLLNVAIIGYIVALTCFIIELLAFLLDKKYRIFHTRMRILNAPKSIKI